ncbi:hypothetical protein GQ44DRAFT_821411 [Phaeosphaeriaceae sp. PMI808]|nr:hypothetical protein GQ44DRAFT_821411 [Phaeosphaeriaceae sp. PMI808]
MYEFITLSHPDEIKDRKKQGKLRQHAIRNGIKRSKADRAKKEGIFVPAEMDGRRKQPQDQTRLSITKAPSVSLLDPFNTLCGCPERLRSLMQHPSAKQAGEPIFCLETSNKPAFQGMETIFKGALLDPSLFHALSLVLSLATNNNLPNVEVLTHRGELLNGIRTNIKALDGTPKVSTITAMLLLIGYEYRIDGANCESIAFHIRGVHAMIKICKAQNVVLVDEVQRALFWQDLLSCLMAGTPRFLSHRDFYDFHTPKDVQHLKQRQLPRGFETKVARWPNEFAVVLQDLNALCWLVDFKCRSDKEPLDVFAVDHNQANIESRLADLLSQCKQSPVPNQWYEAYILCAYVCTYKLSTGIWVGCFIPEICIDRICRFMEQNQLGNLDSHQWEPESNGLMWLLFVSGGMTDHKGLRRRVAELARRIFVGPSEGPSQNWELLKNTLAEFIWCDHTMVHRVYSFWREVYSASAGSRATIQ